MARSLVLGDETQVPAVIRPGRKYGSLLVLGNQFARNGVTVHHCRCMCGLPTCVGEADVDVRFLSSPSLTAQGCSLSSAALMCSFSEWKASIRKYGVNADNYADYLSRGVLPKGSPADPTRFPEWTNWADAIGDPSYRSRQELLDDLKRSINPDVFLLMSETQRYRFLIHQKYFTALRREAERCGLTIEYLLGHPDQLKALIDGLNQPIITAPTVEGGSIGATPTKSIPRNKVENVRATFSWDDLRAELKMFGDSFQAVEGDTFYEVAVEWLQELWNKLDRFGYEKVKSEVLIPLQEFWPALAVEFERQYREVLPYKTEKRKWMQAYAIWYGSKHRAFGNWSEQGTGKTRTVAALVNHLDLRFTVFCGLARTVSRSQIEEQIATEDPKYKLHHIRDGVPESLEPGCHHYLLVYPERFQQEDGSREMVNAILRLEPDFVVIDEAHRAASKKDETSAELEEIFTPRTRELLNFFRNLRPDTRICLMSGSPFRTDVEELKFELSLLNVGAPAVAGRDLTGVQALALRAKLLESGFRFYNLVKPQFERYLVLFRVPDAVAEILNEKGRSRTFTETVRIQYALEALRSLPQNAVINRFNFNTHEYEPVRIDDNPFENAINPVFFTNMVNDGPVAQIENFLRRHEMKFYHCTGESDSAEYDAYTENGDGALIASNAFSTGIDDAQKVSDTIFTLSIPYTPAALEQLESRLVRHGAFFTVIREYIFLAENVEYDRKQFLRCHHRGHFLRALLDGHVAAFQQPPIQELHSAFLAALGSGR